MTKRPKPIVLTVLDGWGYRAETKGNAIALARKPAYDELIQKFPNTLIHTSGPYVGLPEGQMGNSEVGHMNMGAGRIVHMDITRIDLLIANRQLQNVPLFQQAMERGRTRQLHFVGLLSDGGVHSHIQHLFALLEMAKQEKVERVYVHCFMDGRDTPPNSGRDYVRQLQQKMRELGVGEVATLVGRYYAMDRDNRWERVELAYRALVHGEAETKTDDPVAALQKSYELGVTDEFVKPITVIKGKGHVASPEKLEHILAQVFAELQYKNLRTAETEKYAHVTYFFNGGVEKPFAGEERILVPSPKVATYDLKPEMSAAGITDTVVKAVEKGEFDAIIMNYANADMVGHSGKLEAAIKAVEAVDAGLAQIYQALKSRGGVWIITADHGNAETMIDPVSEGPHTYHTTNPVPIILVSDDDKLRLKAGGSLRDIAPTMLGALRQPQPADMTGTDLRIIS